MEVEVGAIPAKGRGRGGGERLTLWMDSSCRRSRLSPDFTSCACIRRIGSRLGKFWKLCCRAGRGHHEPSSGSSVGLVTSQALLCKDPAGAEHRPCCQASPSPGPWALLWACPCGLRCQGVP